MNRFRKLALLALSFVAAGMTAVSAQSLNVATVDMQKLFEGYHLTSKTQEDLNVERAFIQKENAERLTAIREIEEDLKQLRKKLEDTSVSDKKKQELKTEFISKQEEGQAMESQRRQYIQRRDQALKQRRDQSMRAIYEQMIKVIERVAKEGNYDYVFDKSARTARGGSVLLYSKDSSDITSALLKELNKDAPKESATE